MITARVRVRRRRRRRADVRAQALASLPDSLYTFCNIYIYFFIQNFTSTSRFPLMCTKIIHPESWLCQNVSSLVLNMLVVSTLSCNNPVWQTIPYVNNPVSKTIFTLKYLLKSNLLQSHIITSSSKCACIIHEWYNFSIIFSR